MSPSPRDETSAPSAPEAGDGAWSFRAVLEEVIAKTRTPADAVRTFLGETIWRWDLEALPPAKRRLTEALRVLYLVGRAFVSSRAQQQAMALTYTTMLALVPGFAIMVAIFAIRGLEGARGRLETFVIEALAASPEQEATLSRTLTSLVGNLQADGGAAGVTFFVFLFFTIIALLSTLEKTLNDIWQVKRSRSFFNKFVTYWCIATLGPVLLATALVQGSNLQASVDSATTWGREATVGLLSSEEEPEQPAELEVGDDAYLLGGVGGALAATLEAKSDGPEVDLAYVLTGTETVDDERSFSLVAFGLYAVTFTLLYLLFPNTHVRLKPALVGAAVTTLLWTGTKWGLALSSATLVRYNTVYGSLATIPITMFWLYLTWLIVILGAELSFAVQNLRTQRKEELATETTQLFTELVALRLCVAIGRAYDRGLRPPQLDELGAQSGAPVSLCAALLFHLCEDGLLREIEDDNGERAYVPARPLDAISVADVVDSLRERRGIAFDLKAGPDLAVVRRQLDQANAASKALSGRFSLRDVVRSVDVATNGDALPVPLPHRAAAAGPAGPDTAAASVMARAAVESKPNIPSLRGAAGLPPAEPKEAPPAEEAPPEEAQADPEAAPHEAKRS